MFRKALPLVVFLGLMPFMQGAGCRAHYWAQVKGQVELDEQAAKLSGAPIRVVYRKRHEGAVLCDDNWAPCLKRRADWSDLVDCEQLDETTPPGTVTVGKRTYPMSQCTGMVGVDYRADILAFVDVNQSGWIDKGELFGVAEGGPLTRSKEQANQPMRIVINKAFGGGRNATPGKERGATPQPTVPDGFAIAPNKVGPFRLGMTGDSVLQMEGSVRADPDCPCAYNVQHPSGIMLQVSMEKTVCGIVVSSAKHRTKDGLGVDSTIAELVAVHGDAVVYPGRGAIGFANAPGFTVAIAGDPGGDAPPNDAKVVRLMVGSCGE